MPPRATPPQNPGRRRAGLAEGKRPSARTEVPAPNRRGTPSSNPEGLSGAARRARANSGRRTAEREPFPPSRRTGVTIGPPTRLFSQDRGPSGTGALCVFFLFGGGASGNCHQGPDHELPRGSRTGAPTTGKKSGPDGPVLPKEGRGVPRPRPHRLNPQRRCAGLEKQETPLTRGVEGLRSPSLQFPPPPCRGGPLRVTRRASQGWRGRLAPAVAGTPQGKSLSPRPVGRG